ncbi:hypothetical protein M0R45_021876 [Rubus argutus]|uniref:Uncharacterized protein n=1 Tax=Rubus argutus TaxID=59490 RepID=A0AAW1XG61_RUBAR
MQQSSALSVCEEMRTARDSVVCPKPRRFGLLNANFHDPVRSLRWHVGHQGEFCDSKAGSDPLDCILTKGVEQFSFTEIGSPHPFLAGRHRAENGGGCVRAGFGSKPTVRVEGFDCLDRDRRNCSIPSLA